MPSIIEPRRRIDRALWAVVMEAYVAGVSTRSVDDLVAALGAESGISKSEVSRICPSLDERVEAFRIGICWPRRGMGGEGDVRATRAAAFAAEATVSALEAIEREQTLGGGFDI